MSFERHLETLLEQADLSPNLHQPAYEALFPGGKRFRPLLSLEIASMLGLNREKGFDGAAALELIHTYSLIHDDLPCLDNSEWRRGKLTLHKRFGEAIALLTGDFFLTWSFDVLAHSTHLDPMIKLDLIQTLAKAAGAKGMVGGQLEEVFMEKTPALTHLKAIYKGKTGALIEAAATFGAIMASSSPSDREKATLFGRHLGLAFQIRDDLDDFDQDKENSRNTLVTLIGKKGGEKMLNEQEAICLSLFDHPDLNRLLFGITRFQTEGNT